MPTDKDRQALLDAVREEFGVRLLLHDRIDPQLYRTDVTVHTFFPGLEAEFTEDDKHAMRRFVEDHGWQFSRQLYAVEGIPGRKVEYAYLAPAAVLHLAKAYHATRRACLPSIREHGLLPSNAGRQTTSNRLDCEGNIYVCEQLGTSADEGVRCTFSAHWWRHHLANNNRFGDPDWVILEVRLDGLQGARVCRDLWSESGVVISNVTAVPPERVELVA